MVFNDVLQTLFTTRKSNTIGGGFDQSFLEGIYNLLFSELFMNIIFVSNDIRLITIKLLQ